MHLAPIIFVSSNYFRILFWKITHNTTNLVHFTCSLCPLTSHPTVPGNWMNPYYNWRYWYSIIVYAIADTHWVFFGFSFPRNRNRYTFIQTCEIPTVFLFIRPRTTRRTSHKANEFSCAVLRAACENRITKLRKPIFACHTLACTPPRNARMCATLGHIQTVRLRLRVNSEQTESG